MSIGMLFCAVTDEFALTTLLNVTDDPRVVHARVRVVVGMSGYACFNV
jgi:hypothetical protein